MKHAALIFWLSVLLVASVSYGSWLVLRDHSQPASSELQASTQAGQPEWRDTSLPPGKPTPDFALTDQDGKEFHSKSLNGKVWVASFFFASCPGACYRLNQELASIQNDPDFKDVHFVSITCDPSDDTPEVLKTYAAKFNANPKQWTFLTGDLKLIQEIGMTRFLLGIAERTHSEKAVILDKNATVRGYFHLTDPNDAQEIRIRLRALLKEAAPKAMTNDKARMTKSLAAVRH